jgi:hypothetical protein
MQAGEIILTFSSFFVPALITRATLFLLPSLPNSRFILVQVRIALGADLKMVGGSSPFTPYPQQFNYMIIQNTILYSFVLYVALFAE